MVDKIDQFEAELSNPHTSTDERRLALQFLLHLVGDVHQPLHASDDADEGGNLKRVSARGLHAASLHHYWDTEPVLMPPPSLFLSLPRGREMRCSAEPAMPKTRSRASARGGYRRSAGYVRDAVNAVQLQLSRAGVRLAAVLNRAMS